MQKIIILDIDTEAGERIALGIKKSCGDKKVHFIHADVSNHKRMTGKYEAIISNRTYVYSNIIIAGPPIEYYLILRLLYQFVEVFEEASSLLGNIDIVINNAGVLDERRWEKEIAVNIVSIINNNLLIY